MCPLISLQELKAVQKSLGRAPTSATSPTTSVIKFPSNPISGVCVWRHSSGHSQPTVGSVFVLPWLSWMSQTLSLTQWCDKGPIEKSSECSVMGGRTTRAASKGGCEGEQTPEDNGIEPRRHSAPTCHNQNQGNFINFMFLFFFPLKAWNHLNNDLQRNPLNVKLVKI